MSLGVPLPLVSTRGIALELGVPSQLIDLELDLSFVLVLARVYGLST
jgi:hypothetical protein